jgi:hypothetical protein
MFGQPIAKFQSPALVNFALPMTLIARQFVLPFVLVVSVCATLIKLVAIAA